MRLVGVLEIAAYQIFLWAAKKRIALERLPKTQSRSRAMSAPASATRKLMPALGMPK
jgi:hypothetical protein